MSTTNHHFCYWIVIIVVTLVGGTKLIAKNAAPQHPLVGKPFKPTDVDRADPVYETSFEDEAVLRDCRLEGGKQMSIANGSLVLESQPTSNDKNHLVCWLSKEVPADFLLEFTVRPKNRKEGLNIVFFNARGVNGQSIFDPSLQKRNGIFRQYHSGDLNNYHVSYWAGTRDFSNLRKNRGFHLVSSGKDYIVAGDPNAFQSVQIYKRGGKIRVMVDGLVAIAFDDDGKTFGPVHDHSGWIGLRQMGHTLRCEYGHLKIYRLLPIGQKRGSARQQRGAPPPTHADVQYGPHERNVVDFWQVESAEPTPLVVFIHGGGFRGGSKNNINARTLRELLDAGISVAAVNYRLISHAPLPAAHYDCRRALQFLRAKAEQWNIDKTRVGTFGGSAGAQICMWLAFHDEMAQPESSDPIERESTRLTCVATNGGQTTMDMDWWKRWIPGYEEPHRDFFQTFGVKTKGEYLKKVAEVSALSLISKDDPPIFMSYGMAPDDPIPKDPKRAQGWKVHHVMFGVKLKEKMDELGVEAHLKYTGAKTAYASLAEFFAAKLVSRVQNVKKKP